jgi:hypothetical protein
MMSSDLTGGLPLSREDVFATAPRNPEMREAVNIWLHDDQGRFSLPRIGIEAIAASWSKPAVQANMAFSDGRVLVGSCVGQAHDPLDHAGRPRVMGAGPVRFQSLEPFRRWTMTFAGDALDTSIADQAAGIIPDGPRVDVEIHVDMTMVVPPWIQGEMGADARKRLEGDEGLLMGGDRYEQLFTATGTFRVGADTMEFEATGLRIHRQGVRDTSEFRGHCWQSAVFASGKAFGYIAYPNHDDGTPAYREGYIYDGERMIPAEVVDAPWLTKFEPEAGPVPLVLQAEQRRLHIDGSTTTSTAMAGRSGLSKVAAISSSGARQSLFFHQGGARYTWDGENAYGMIERSLPIDAVQL